MSDPLRPFLGGPNRVLNIRGKGRGVIATRDYRRGQLIERAPVIVFLRKELRDDGRFAFYVYDWSEKEYAVALGQGSLYNHSYEPNARYRMDKKTQTMRYIACRAIRAGEEITTNYLYHPDATGSVGFDPV